MGVYQLIYQSVRTVDLDAKALRGIAAESAVRNAAKGITGVLLMQGDSILQVLEGPEDAVRSVYDTIAQDRRHHGCVILFARQTGRRSFDSWTMGFCEVDEDGVDHFRMTISALRARQMQVSKTTRKLAS